jgi:hypothetical protein
MSRSLAIAVAAAGIVAATPVFAQSTTRIEPRPFYGATVTIEEGVRVFRPLPPERHVIINPNGTPLNLSINDTTVRQYSSSTSHNTHTHRHTGRGLGYYQRRFAPGFGH